MPTQLPLEATVYFGSKLLPLIPQILELDAKKNFQIQTNIPRVIRDVSQFSFLGYERLCFEKIGKFYKAHY